MARHASAQRAARVRKGGTRAATTSSCSPAVSPSRLRAVTPAASAALSAPTLTAKNSSRLPLTMARKRSRSASGTPGSSAISSTRSWNASWASSTLRNRSGGSSFVARGGAARCPATGIAREVAGRFAAEGRSLESRTGSASRLARVATARAASVSGARISGVPIFPTASATSIQRSRVGAVSTFSRIFRATHTSSASRSSVAGSELSRKRVPTPLPVT